MTADSKGMSDAAESALLDLASHLGIEPDRIEVLTDREVTWSDTSLGCPQPGMSYAQRLTPGSQIVLRADGVEHHYHAGAGRGPFRCATPKAPAAPGRSGTEI